MEELTVEQQATQNVHRRLKTFRLMMDLGETRTHDEVVSDMIAHEAERIRQRHSGALAIATSIESQSQS